MNGSKLNVAYVDEWPFSFNRDDAGPTGFDIEIVEELSNCLELEAPNFTEIHWEDIVPSLRSGRFDLVVTGLAWSEERAEAGEPTEPLYTVSSAAYVAVGNPLRIHGLQDLATSKGRVATIRGALETDVLRPHLGGQLVTFEDEEALWSAIDGAEIVAALFAEVAGDQYLREHPNARFEKAVPFQYPELPKAMYWVSKGAHQLAAAIGDCVQGLKRDGTLSAILLKHGYPPGHDLPVGATPI